MFANLNQFIASNTANVSVGSDLSLNESYSKFMLALSVANPVLVDAEAFDYGQYMIIQNYNTLIGWYNNDNGASFVLGYTN